MQAQTRTIGLQAGEHVRNCGRCIVFILRTGWSRFGALQTAQRTPLHNFADWYSIHHTT
ncbi:hypothetical protein CD178_03445 (plasmid) [Komagataeibacter saccharivorans]|uniref:Uncharacterized protein n=1 Tax=Komagataeibacter saccharivorans TaxID=265959 RepID=A0A347WH46_9PROT|nr:hypothetical protein CD178_03445 [Komagataeibacter saccharivorans]